MHPTASFDETRLRNRLEAPPSGNGAPLTPRSRSGPRRQISADAVLATIREGIVVIAPNWTIQYVNEVAENILGAPAAALIDADHWQRFPETIGSGLERMYRHAMDHGRVSEIEYFSPQLRCWFHVKAYPSPHGLTICFRDITAAKQEQETEHASEERFRLAAANRYITLYEQDENLRYTWLYPLHPEHRHALGRTDEELSRDGSASELVALKRLAMASNSEVRREITVMLGSGERHYDLFITPRRDAAGRVIGVAGAALDITARKTFERALSESEERLRTTYDHAPVGIAEIDLTGTLISANAQFCTQLGYGSGDVLGRPLAALAHGDDSTNIGDDVADLVATNGPQRVSERRLVHKQGRIVWVSLTLSLNRDRDGQPAFGLVIAQDVTDKKRATTHQHLLYRLVATVNRAGAANEIYEAAMDALCQSQGCTRGSILLNDESGVMRFVAWRGLSEDYRRAVEGHSPWAKDDPNPRPVCIADVAKCELDSHLRTVVEAERIRALAFIPLVLENRLLGKFMVYFDEPHEFRAEELQVAETTAHQVSFAIERQRASHALEALVATRTASLQQAIQQMEEFSYTVSHDLRAPVRAMITYAEAIVEDDAGRIDPSVRDFLERILKNARRMDALVRDTLAYSRVARRDLTLEPVSLDRVVQDAITTLDDARPKRGAIHVAAPLGTVVAHEPSLAQAVSNLLNNALKFTRPGVAPKIEINALPSRDCVRLSIIDNGIGVPPELQSRLFRIFERLHPQGVYDGTGIGLAIVRKAIERMGGQVGVESDGKSGSTFWIEVPAATEAATKLFNSNPSSAR